MTLNFQKFSIVKHDEIERERERETALSPLNLVRASWLAADSFAVSVRDSHRELRHHLLAGRGAQAQTDPHVERPLQPRHTQELPGHRHGVQ